ncbi:hypothetical protein ACLB2K_061621 [Fragaria x ananassa]
MDDFADGSADQLVIRLRCANLFHAHCISQWLEVNRVCPLCRYAIPKEVDIEPSEIISENVEPPVHEANFEPQVPDQQQLANEVLVSTQESNFQASNLNNVHDNTDNLNANVNPNVNFSVNVESQDEGEATGLFQDNESVLEPNILVKHITDHLTEMLTTSNLVIRPDQRRTSALGLKCGRPFVLHPPAPMTAHLHPRKLQRCPRLLSLTGGEFVLFQFFGEITQNFKQIRSRRKMEFGRLAGEGKWLGTLLESAWVEAHHRRSWRVENGGTSAF